MSPPPDLFDRILAKGQALGLERLEAQCVYHAIWSQSDSPPGLFSVFSRKPEASNKFVAVLLRAKKKWERERPLQRILETRAIEVQEKPRAISVTYHDGRPPLRLFIALNYLDESQKQALWREETEDGVILVISADNLKPKQIAGLLGQCGAKTDSKDLLNLIAVTRRQMRRRRAGRRGVK